MGAPIIVGQRQNPWTQLLPQLFMQKIQHKQQMERDEARREDYKAEADRERKYNEGQKREAGKTALKVAGWKELPQSARLHAEKTGTAQSDVENINGTWMRRPGEPTPRVYELGGKQFVAYGNTLKPIDESQKSDNLTTMQLTKRALAGDPQAKAILDKMQADKMAIAKAGAMGKVSGLNEFIDVEGTANAIIDGRETIENVKNTFGIPIQETIRKAVLAKDKSFNFLLPRAAYKNIASSLRNQEKQRGMMGSFVGNIQKQLKRVDEIGKDLTRVDPRLLNIPIRQWKTRVAGSGHEKAFEAYLLEISNEIAKLSTGSQASIRELSTDAQERWAKIHDPNLSLADLKIILSETDKMAEMRLQSTNDEIEFHKSRLKNIRKETQYQSPPTQETKPSAVQLDADDLIKKYGGK